MTNHQLVKRRLDNTEPSDCLAIYDYQRNVTISTALDKAAYKKASVESAFDKIEDPKEREILIKTNELENEKNLLIRRH